MSKANRQIEVLDTAAKTTRIQDTDFISLTEIARHRDSERSDKGIRNWVRNRRTLEFPGILERIHNPESNSVEFDGFMNRIAIEKMEILTSDRNLTRLEDES